MPKFSSHSLADRLARTENDFDAISESKSELTRFTFAKRAAVIGTLLDEMSAYEEQASVFGRRASDTREAQSLGATAHDLLVRLAKSAR
jgi:hypothetical protein